MPMPYPELTAAGRGRLDELLKAKIGEGSVPSIFWAATNATETIYENQAGYRAMEDETSGPVTPETSEYSVLPFMPILY